MPKFKSMPYLRMSERQDISEELSREPLEPWQQVAEDIIHPPEKPVRKKREPYSAKQLGKVNKDYPMRLFALIQADDYEQWIAVEILAPTWEEAEARINAYYDFDVPIDPPITFGRLKPLPPLKKYLNLVELGGTHLIYVKKMKPLYVYERTGLFGYKEIS